MLGFKGTREEVGVTEIRMIRWMHGHTRNDNAQNDYTKRYWCNMNLSKNFGKSNKVVWTHTKVTRNTYKESRLHDY